VKTENPSECVTSVNIKHKVNLKSESLKYERSIEFSQDFTKLAFLKTFNTGFMLYLKNEKGRLEVEVVFENARLRRIF
jgi:hypothetical protein